MKLLDKPLKFFGAYVVNVSCSLGWGGESSSCTLSLVEDTKKKVFFKPPKLGSPCLFKVNDFKFGGIFQSYTEKESVSGGKQYDVVLESPSAILDGVIVVLNGFQGTVYKEDFYLPYEKPVLLYGVNGPTNLFNVFAKKENSVTGGIFGGSKADSTGYPVDNIIYDIYETVTQQVTIAGSNIPGYYGGKIYYANAEYVINLDGLIEPVGRILGYRINSNFISLNSLVGEICEQAGYDYIITIDGDKVKDGVIVDNPKIIVKTLERTSQPSPGMIGKIISDYKKDSKSKSNLVSYELGKEFSNDVVTQKVMLGGNVSRYWMSNFDYNTFEQKYMDHILPIFGTAQVATEYGPDTIYYFSTYDDFNNAYAEVTVVSDGGSTNNFSLFKASMLEIRCAASSRRTWNAYHSLLAVKKKIFPELPFEPLKFGLIYDFELQDFNKLLEGNILPNELQNTSMDSAEDYALAAYLGADPIAVYEQRRTESRWNAVSAVAGSYYGKEFFVKVPGELGGISNTLKYVEDGLKIESAWNASSSAWSSASFRSLFSDIKAYDENSRFKAIAIYDNFKNADYSSLGKEYVITPFGVGTMDVNVNGEKTIWQEVQVKNSLTGQPDIMSAGFVPVSTPEILLYDGLYTEFSGFGILFQLIFGMPIPKGMQDLLGSESIEVEIGPHKLLPKMIGIPQESSRYVWGPWFSYNADTVAAGKIEVLEKPEFVPEAFGSIDAMNQFGQAYVNAEMASIYENESGYVELAELPTGSLGDKFLSSGPYITEMSISLGSDGIKTTYKFRTWTKTAGKIAKYNIERVSKLQRQSFEFFKNIRNSFISPVPKAINRKLLGMIEKASHKNNGSRSLPNDYACNMQSSAFVRNSFNVINQTSTPTNSTGGGSVNSFNISPDGSVSASPAVNPSLPPSSVRKVSKVHAYQGTIQGNIRSIAKNYNASFGCSNEQIFSPVLTFNQPLALSGTLVPSSIRIPNQKLNQIVNTGEAPNVTGDFPSFEIANKYDPTHTSGVFYRNHILPTSFDLDPYFKFSEIDFTCVYKDTLESTKDFNIIKDPIKSYVRTMGLRGPILLSGWGYDVAGLPVPNNASGDTASSGIWEFPSGVATDRAEWKTGPVDLSWHEGRKVWTGGARILEGFLMEDLNGAELVKMEVFRRPFEGGQVERTNDLFTKSEILEIRCLDENLTASSGAYIMVTEVNYEWRPIWVSCKTN